MGGMYPNGEWPLSMFEHLGGDHWAPAGTAARWRALVTDVLEHEGILLVISPGWNVYRPLSEQKKARAELGIYAAWPGTSSHGMLYRGRPFCAIDVYNWARLGWEKFKHYAEKHGFIVDFVSPQELWHIGDPNPWELPVAAGGAAAPVIDYALLRRQKEQDMYVKNKQAEDVYCVFTDANGAAAMRVCSWQEAQFALQGGLVIEANPDTITRLGIDTGYGRKIVPTVAGNELHVIVKIDPGVIDTTYALWAPGYWVETTNPDVANGWAQLYGNAENITYQQWDDRKAIAVGGATSS